MSSLAQLKAQFAKAVAAGRLEAALSALKAIAQREPKNPAWPRRAARLYRARGDGPRQLKALRCALELQISQGLVLDAIASCQSILELVPADEDTLDCLDLLYLNGSSQLGAAPQKAAEPLRKKDALTDPPAPNHAPLDTIHLAQAVPGAHAVLLGDSEPGRVSEIPIDDSLGGDATPADEEVLDLRLECWSESSDPAEQEAQVAAAQAAVFPTPMDVERASSSFSAASSFSGPAGTRSLRSQLADVPLFGELDPESLHLLIRKVRVVQLEAGQVLFREGDAANSLYVVVDGAVVPIAEGDRRHKLAVLERGDFFGETGLITGQPRNATIEALVDTQLLAIDRQVLWQLIEHERGVLTTLMRFLRARLIDRQIRTNLFFAAFGHAERAAVARQFRMLEVQEGARVVSAGKPPEGLFVVLSGRLALWDRKRGKVVRELGAGGVLGAQTLLQAGPSPFDARAIEKCWVVVLGEGRFRRILDANPRLSRVLKRLAQTSEGLSSERRAGAAGGSSGTSDSSALGK